MAYKWLANWLFRLCVPQLDPAIQIAGNSDLPTVEHSAGDQLRPFIPFSFPHIPPADATIVTRDDDVRLTDSGMGDVDLLSRPCIPPTDLPLEVVRENRHDCLPTADHAKSK